MDRVFTFEEKDDMSRAFDAGNYAHAYESEDLEDFDVEEMPEHERAAFVLGFFSSLMLDEIGMVEREAFDAAYYSDAGRYVVQEARFTDDRADEYEEERAAYEAECMTE